MPFKGLAAPKRRLRAALSREERRGLARAMLSDVLTALVASTCFERVLLVSREAPVLELGSTLGAEPLTERGPTSYSAAAQQAAEYATTAGAAALLVVPADLPLAGAADFIQLVERAESAAVALVPSGGGGTNALLTRPPGAIAYQFGPDSFATHLAAARRSALPVVVLDIPRLRLDVDRPGDLRRLFGAGALAAETATWRFLTDSGLSARLTLRAGSAPRASAARGAAAPGPSSPS